MVTTLFVGGGSTEAPFTGLSGTAAVGMCTNNAGHSTAATMCYAHPQVQLHWATTLCRLSIGSLHVRLLTLPGADLIIHA